MHLRCSQNQDRGSAAAVPSIRNNSMQAHTNGTDRETFILINLAQM